MRVYWCNIHGLYPYAEEIIHKQKPYLDTKASYLCTQDAVQHLAGLALLYYGWRNYRWGEFPRICWHGKPHFIADNLQFNISHSNALVACAVGEEPCGQDVQIIEDEPLPLEIFTSEESCWIQKQPNSRKAIFNLWVGKEALLKARGLPFSHLFSQDSLIDTNGCWRNQIDTWHLHWLSLADGYATCFCTTSAQIHIPEQVDTKQILSLLCVPWTENLWRIHTE